MSAVVTTTECFPSIWQAKTLRLLANAHMECGGSDNLQQALNAICQYSFAIVVCIASSYTELCLNMLAADCLCSKYIFIEF